MDAIDQLLTRGVDKIYPSKEALEKVLRSGKKLRLYQGFDPTGKLLHIGHMAGLMKLSQFQKLGHHVIFLIGDGTGQAGDPSGKSQTRNRFFNREELRENAKDYVRQANKIVNFEGDNPAEILFNGDWLNKLTLTDILEIFGKFSVQQLIERDMFQERLKADKPINLREFIYPLLQGYDSVAMKVDLEIGGTDQTFNMLTGRQLVSDILRKEKFVLTLPLLSDRTGKKIGKTEGNVIALSSPPVELYGMIMNLPDEVISKCFELITDLPMTEVQNIESEIKSGKNPMVYKKKLAFTLVRLLNSANEAETAQENFEKTFQEKKLPENLETRIIGSTVDRTIIDALAELAPEISRSQLKRLISQGAVEINGSKISDPNSRLQLHTGSVVKLGKHQFFKINLKS